MDVCAYLAAAPEARRPTLVRLRELCLEELPGFEEGIAYGMPVYVRAGGTAGEIAWANQKQYISFYLMRTDIRDAFAARLAPHDMGKACLRFRNPDRVSRALVPRVASRWPSATLDRPSRPGHTKTAGKPPKERAGGSISGTGTPETRERAGRGEPRRTGL